MLFICPMNATYAIPFFTYHKNMYWVGLKFTVKMYHKILQMLFHSELVAIKPDVLWLFLLTSRNLCSREHFKDLCFVFWMCWIRYVWLVSTGNSLFSTFLWKPSYIWATLLSLIVHKHINSGGHSLIVKYFSSFKYASAKW